MKRTRREKIHILYRLGIMIKALIGALEVFLGTAFIFLSHSAIYAIINSATLGELSEAPRDVFAGILAKTISDIASTPEKVWAIVFLSHGLVKLALIFGLWKERIWAYPTSAVIFTVFIVYQLYQLAFAPSVLLWIITLLDALIIVLIVYEYRVKKKSVVEQILV